MTSKAFGLAQLGNAYSDGALSNRNKVINGAMVVNQRAAGTVNSEPGVNPYIVDRFRSVQSAGVAGAFSSQQSTTAPTGFTNSFLTTALVATSFSGNLYHAIRQPIEGFNCADLMWGTAAAVPITVSFWVRSSLTGTFGGAIGGQSGSRSYPFTYTVSAADTWEFKTITLAGDTAGTWATDNTGAINLWFSLGAGPDRKGTAGAWNANFNTSATGAVDINATNGATFYLTGVQLEAGDTATPFEHRSYGQELALCQRYFCKSYAQSITPGNATQNGAPTLQITAAGTGQVQITPSFPVTMRASPSMTLYDLAGASGVVYRGANGAAGFALSATDRFQLVFSVGASAAEFSAQFTASAEL